MVETLQGSGLWHVTLAETDLVEQAGLSPGDFEQDVGCFRYRGRPVIMSHTYGQHLVVSMEGEEDGDLDQLMDGFSRVVGYQPFCRYKLLPGEKANHSALPTYEWDRVDPDARFAELGSKETVADLVRI